MTAAEVEELQVQKRRAEGTPCNKENFEAWQAKFLAEMAERERLLGLEGGGGADAKDGGGVGRSGSRKAAAATKDLSDANPAKAGRLTGYEQFASKLDNFDALEAAAEEAENEVIDEELFLDEEDVDLEDLDFDDEEEEDDDDGEELDI
jgi:hypothetical protein